MFRISPELLDRFDVYTRCTCILKMFVVQYSISFCNVGLYFIMGLICVDVLLDHMVSFVTVVGSIVAMIVSVFTMRRSAHEFKVSKIIERQQFLYDKRMDVYSIVYQILSSVKNCSSHVQYAIDHIDDLDFDYKELFLLLCNNHYMSMAQQAVNISDLPAQRDYLSNVNHLAMTGDTLFVLFDGDMGYMLEDVICAYVSVLECLYSCVQCFDGLDSDNTILTSERLRLLVDVNHLCDNLKCLKRQGDLHEDMRKMGDVLLFIRNDLYAERKRLKISKPTLKQ